MSMRLVLGSLAALVIGAAVAVLVGSFAWTSQSTSLRRQLDRGARTAPGAFSAADLEELPPPVERFFRHVLTEGQPLVRAVELTTEGEFQTGTGDAGWRPFTATQQFSTTPP